MITMEERQLINVDRPTMTSSAEIPHCTPFTLPSAGVLTMNDTDVYTLTADAIFQPECTATSDTILAGAGSPTWQDLRDPFYASTIPECYALAATTVIAYMLVIMLLITPRTFLHEGAVVLGRRGFTNGPSGSNAGIGIGGRPWLQKVAALTVAISLTIATGDTFKVAEQQYEMGLMDAQKLQQVVENGTELKVIRVLSDTFLWLAQAQTLIRLFPRQREKIIIKWTAFALITLDALFSILNNFVYAGSSRPRSFVDAVPALAYLFQLALSLLYAAWVIYYSITKKRFAFYHPQMRNIGLVALLSLVAVLVPVVFFVLDISKPTLAGWGDYVRWVGAAAASVVVWEWVERIESLERDDKKDGVLGREVFDGDELLDDNLTVDSWEQRVRSRMSDDRGKDERGGGGVSSGSHGTHWPGMSGLANRYRSRRNHDVEAGRRDDRNKQRTTERRPPPLWPTRPPAAATPISRADTASAESTVYAIRYHPINEPTAPRRRESLRPTTVSRHNSLDITRAQEPLDDSGSNDGLEKPTTIDQKHEGAEIQHESRRPNPFQTLSKMNIFRHQGREPPPEVSAQIAKAQKPITAHGSTNRWDVRARLENFAATQAEKLREKAKPSVNVEPLPVTIIPAPPRRRNLRETLEELESAERVTRTLTENSTTYLGSPLNPTLSRTVAAADAQSLQNLHPQRLSDPYTPSDLNGHSIHQRRAISFVTANPQDREDELSSPVSPVSPLEGSRFSPISSRSSQSQPHSPLSPRRDGLPFLSIPAPPRQPRSGGE